MVCEKNSLFAPINRSIRCLNGASSAKLFRYTIVNQGTGCPMVVGFQKKKSLRKQTLLRFCS